MIPVSIDYKRQLIAGNRNYLIKADVFLKGNTSSTPDFTLTNEHIWDNGIVIDQSTSSDDTFDIGAAIIGSLKVIIDNINGDFSQYDFYDAKITLYLGVTGDVDEHDVQRYYRIGFYVVDEPNYNGSLITLNCLDNMTWFDVPFEGVTVSSPTTAGSLVGDICSHVGVFLGTPQFPNYTMSITVPDDIKSNCREVLQYVAQMCCCYCKIDTAGELNLKWYNKYDILNLTDYDGGTYNTNTTPYSDGCDLDGGHFNPWDGDSADGGTFADLMNSAYLSQNYEINVSTDDIVVTGCRVRNTTSKDDSYDEIWVDPNVEANHERYVLVIENNPFITSTNAATIANIVGSILAGLPIRGYTATSLSDFSYETGDMVTVIDFRGHRYYTWITHFTFTTNNSEGFSCGVESLRKRSEERFSSSVKTLAEANENASAALTEYDSAVKAMNELAQSAIDYNTYEHTVTGTGLVTWKYNGTSVDTNPPASAENPYFPNSTVVFKISGDGVFVARGDDIDPITGEILNYSDGYDANSGTAILSLIYAHGLIADWIKAGTLTLGGYNNVNGLCEVYDANNVKKVWLDEDGLHANKGEIDGTLTIGSNGEIGSYGSNMKGFCASNGSLGISVDEGSSWSALTYGDESYAKTGWGKACVVLWNGGNQDAGFHVIGGAPPTTSGKTFTAMKYNIFEFWRAYNAQAWLDESGFQTRSDRNKKKNIKQLLTSKTRKFFEKLTPSSFKYKDDEEGKTHYGVIAQDLEEALNYAKLPTESLIRTTENNDGLFVTYSELHGLELAGIKDLYEIVESQKQEIDTLKKELAELKERVK